MKRARDAWKASIPAWLLLLLIALVTFAPKVLRKHRPMIRDLVSIKLGGWPPCGYCELYRPLSRTCGGMKYELEPCRVMSRRIYLYFQDKEGKDE